MTDVVPDRRPGPLRLAALALLLVGVSGGLATFSAWPWVATAPDAAVLRVSLRAVTGSAVPAPLSRDVRNLPVHMRPLDGSAATSGRRADAVLTVEVDGAAVLTRTYHPTGLRRDGPVYGYEEVPLAPGRHAVRATLTDRSVPAASRAWSVDGTVMVRPGEAPLLEFRDGAWHWD